MLRAIDRAAAPGLFAASSRTDGLRAIRLFEHLNGCAFDPTDFLHVVMVTNSGWHFRLQRRLKALRGAREAVS